MSSPFAAHITGTGSAFPERRLTNAEIASKIDTTDAWIRERTGISERRISEPGNPKEQNSSLALAASLKALEMAGKRPEDVDQILYATATPDTLVPNTACWLQNKLGARNAAALDLNAACSGFVYALAIADQFIRSGQSRCILVVGAEVLSTFVNWQDRGSCILFGDGAGAALVERAPADSSSRILSSHLGSDGSHWDLLHVDAGGSNIEVTPEAHAKGLDKIQMKGKETFKVAVKTLSDYADLALKANGLSQNDLNWFVPHQANMRIIEAVAKRLELPMEKVLTNIEFFGNTSSATVPTVLDQSVRSGKIKTGDTVLLDVFGAGLTYGSILIRW